MSRGVAREKGRGLTEYLYYKKETIKLDVVRSGWTLRVFTLRRDTKVPSLVFLSLYDIKPL